MGQCIGDLIVWPKSRFGVIVQMFARHFLTKSYHKSCFVTKRNFWMVLAAIFSCK